MIIFQRNQVRCFFSPEKELLGDDLLLVHSQIFVDSLQYSDNIVRYCEVGDSWVTRFILPWVPCFILDRYILQPMRLASQGTVDATLFSWKNQCNTVNIGGGYHHAKPNKGEGFCVFSDIGIAIKKLQEINPDIKVLYVDLDAHQGNGVSDIFKNDDNISIFDMYGGFNYPVIHLYGLCPEGVDYHVALDMGVDDVEYLQLLKEKLPQAIAMQKPDIIFYNAGTDILIGDPLGQLSVTVNGIIERDEFVFEQGEDNSIPVVMVLSGGYEKQSYHVIGESIVNLIEKGFLPIFSA